MQEKSENKQRRIQARFYIEYKLFAMFLTLIAIYAFILDSPSNIFTGFIQIISSRSILITDYMFVGGPGAMLVNGALSGLFGLVLMMGLGVKPNGATLMSLWMTVGFGFFGKNILNMIPLTIGVWLFSRFQKERFINYSLAALLVATLSPVVSELAHNSIPGPGRWVVAILAGIVTGFFFPAVSSFTVRVHDGFNLYNMGFSGGLIATLLIALLKALGITIKTVELWGTGYKAEMSVLLYIISAGLIASGFILGRGRNHVKSMNKILRSSGRLVSDYYTLYGETTYINMGCLGILATTIALLSGMEINGPTMGGILTIIAFGGFGKHPKNVSPIFIGAFISTYVNTLDPTAPMNSLAVLFSTGLAPIAGQYGTFWGIIAGFVHVSIVIHAGYISNGLNLYNNGFAAGFVAMIFVPIIITIKNFKTKKR